MRRRGTTARGERILLVLTLATGMGAGSRASAQDFDPAGRRHAAPHPSPSGAGGARSGAPRRHPESTAAPGAVARRGSDDGSSGAPGEARGPGRDALIARYTALVLSQPATPFAMQRLAQLYRERDGDLKRVIADFEHRAEGSGPDHHAAVVALGALYDLDGRLEEAEHAYERAIAERPGDGATLVALAKLLRDHGQTAAARQRYEQALAVLPASDRETTLRALIGLSLDDKDFDGAKKYQRELLRIGQGGFSTRSELARELMARGEWERAEAELRELVQAAAGDNRALAPALRDLGRVLAKEHKNEQALEVLKRALAAAGAEAGVRKEIFEITTDLYRSENRLGELIEIVEREHPTDVQRLAMLAALYEETGQVDKAVAAYRRALGRDPRNIDLRVKLVRLLQARGDLEEATAEYEGLIRSAPRNPDYVFELCDILLLRGERARALDLLTGLESRSSADDDVLARIADFYERIGEKQRSIALLARIAARSPGDPQHLVDLGDRYYQQGDKKRAVETWNRIKLVLPNRAKALATLGDVFLEHDMPAEGLDALREAATLEPKNTGYRKSYAMALERTATGAPLSATTSARFEEALGIWEQLLRAAGPDRNLAREARTHLVTLWGLLHRLEQQIGPLEHRFSTEPPDIEAGRLLAEVQVRMHRLAEAESTLRRVTERAPGDEEAFLALERVLVQKRDLAGAIEVLKKLAALDPQRAREFYQRMAEYAAELYRDKDAIGYAQRAVQLSPDDADGHRKLAEMYRREQDTAHAISEFRAAIAKNDRLFPVYFELAELLLAEGQAEEADRLFRRVVRAAPDDELVSQAARASMQINLGKGSLSPLEQDLLPASIGNPQRPIFRRLLVELYGAMAFPLVQSARHGSAEEAARATEELRRIGARAVKPLLDALGDDRPAQQRVAVDLLAFADNKSAGPALFAFATGSGEQGLRVRAMMACGELRDAALLPKYESFLFPKEQGAILPGDPVAIAAAWAVATLGNRRASPLLGRMLTHTTPEIRAFAAIGLGTLHDRAAARALIQMAQSPDSGALGRAAAAFALGDLGARDANAVLSALARDPEPLAREAALVALARTSGPTAPRAIAENLFAPDPALRQAALSAALVLTTQSYRGPSDPLASIEDPPDPRAALGRLAPERYSAEERAAALVALVDPIRDAALAAAETESDRAEILADALLSRGGAPALAPFTEGIETLSPDARERAERAAEAVARTVVPAFARLERHPALAVRMRAVQFLAHRGEDEAQAALVDALGDADERIQRATLAAVAAPASPALVEAVARILGSDGAWVAHVEAAQALGRIGRAAPGKGDPRSAVTALRQAARSDPYALSRLAALHALSGIDRGAALEVARAAVGSDPEPRVREAAAELLSTPR